MLSCHSGQRQVDLGVYKTKHAAARFSPSPWTPGFTSQEHRMQSPSPTTSCLPVWSNLFCRVRYLPADTACIGKPNPEKRRHPPSSGPGIRGLPGLSWASGSELNRRLQRITAQCAATAASRELLSAGPGPRQPTPNRRGVPWLIRPRTAPATRGTWPLPPARTTPGPDARQRRSGTTSPRPRRQRGRHRPPGARTPPWSR